MEKAEIWILTVNYVYPQFYKSHLMIKTKIVIASNVQDNDF